MKIDQSDSDTYIVVDSFIRNTKDDSGTFNERKKRPRSNLKNKTTKRFFKGTKYRNQR